MGVTVIAELLSTASQDLGNLGDTLREANLAAAIPTTGIATPAADEVSASITSLFNSHAAAYQELAARAQAFHHRFLQTVAAAGNAYQEADLACQNMLRAGITELGQPLTPFLQASGFYIDATPPSGVAPMPTNVSTIALVMGGTSGPVVPQFLLSQIGNMYFPGTTAYGLYTPEQLWPLTPMLGTLTLNQSVALGTQGLNSAIMTQLGLGHNVTVWGTSQSSIIITDEIRNLMAQGSPGVNQLQFISTGNMNNPDGGLSERFTGLYVPLLDISLNGATPPNSPYPTTIYTNQYDVAGDFPRYPLNLVSDTNAVLGFFYGTHDYGPPMQLSSYAQLPTSPGYAGNTTYYMSLTQNLPLTDPLRYGLPAPYGNALADLIQPDLRVIVDMGYGSNGYGNIPTPASLLEIPNPFTIGPDLVHGAVQGAQGFMADLGYGTAPTGYPATPVLNPGLNFDLPQTPVTGLSLLTSAEGWITQQLF